MNLYIKYPMNTKLIFEVLEKKEYKTITFFLDLQNIAKGLFNKKVIELEISKYDENPNLTTLPFELFEYIKKLNKIFIKYDPYFVIFYDSGESYFHKSINKNYKSNRTIVFDDQILVNIYYTLKEYYFNIIHEVLNRYDNISVVYLRNFESDFIPKYVIDNNFVDTKLETNMNLILSTDKDLLQCLNYNTYQYVVTFKNKYDARIYDKRNAIKYIYNNFKPGILTAEYIPLILSIAGDKSDNIVGIKGYGYKKAIDLIIKYQLLPDLSNIEKIKDIVDISIIKQNYKLISFDYIIRNLPNRIEEYLRKLF